MEDCGAVRAAGYTKSGIYNIDPDGKGKFEVFCEMKKDGSGRKFLSKIDFLDSFVDTNNLFLLQ